MTDPLPANVSAQARDRILYPVWLLFMLVAGIEALATIPSTVQAIPFLLSVVFLGLPHGALDHLILPRARGTDLTLRWMGTVGLIYAGLGTAYLLLWTITPAAVFLSFILLTWFHWGEGDLYATRTLLGDQERGTIHTAATILVRGGAPMVLPLIAYPDQYLHVVDVTLHSVAPGTTAPVGAFTPSVRLAALAGYLITAFALCAITYSKAQRQEWLHSTADITILTVFFLTVPPLFAIGIYFCLWHSLRHVFRYTMLDQEAQNALEEGSILPAARRFAIDAAPLTIVSLGIFALIYHLLPATAGTDGLIGTYLILLAILTLPHSAIMIVLDREQGLY